MGFWSCWCRLTVEHFESDRLCLCRHEMYVESLIMFPWLWTFLKLLLRNFLPVITEHTHTLTHRVLVDITLYSQHSILHSWVSVSGLVPAGFGRQKTWALYYRPCFHSGASNVATTQCGTQTTEKYLAYG